MAVQLDPASQLSFERPLTRSSSEVLLVGNPHNVPVMFKIKTTAPRQYCVRPNAGRIEAQSQIEVQVILQPFSQEPPVDHKCKDKFLIQTAMIKPVYEALPLAEMWAITEAEDRANIFQQKIKCSFRPPASPPSLSSRPQQQVNQKASPSVPGNIPEQELAAASEAAAAVASAGDEHRADEKQKQPNNSVVQHDTTTATGRPNTSKDDPDTTRLKDELQQALELVEQLKNQIAVLELTRKEDPNDQQPPLSPLPQLTGAWDKACKPTASARSMHVEEGYPPQVVMAIASLVFVFTYLFF